MSIRLNKVLKECNIGLQSAVDFLHKKGFADIEADPNTKISDEQYEMLTAEFNKDKGLKNDAKALSFKRQHKEKKTAIAIDESKTKQPESKKITLGFPKIIGNIKDIFNRRNKKQPAAQPAAEQPAPAMQEPKPEMPVTKPETPATQPAPQQPAPAPQEPKPQTPDAKPETPTAKPETSVPEQQPENKPLISEKKPSVSDSQPPVSKKEPQKSNNVAEKLNKTEEKPKEVKKKTDTAPKPAPAPEKKDESSVKTGSDNVFRIPVDPKDGVHITVKGQIDLSTINPSMRPRKKTREERRREHTDKSTQPQNASGQPAKSGRKKRIRIGQQRVDITAVSNQPADVSRKTPKAGNANAQGNKQGRRGGLRHTPIARPEVSDEDVAKQVKETLARLTGKNKINKGAKYRKEKRESARTAREEERQERAAESKVLKLTEFVTANELASMMNVPVTEVISTCMSVGIMVSINQRMDAETINLVADEFGFKTEYVSAAVSEAVVEEEDDEADLVPRAPIVTVMGHVDHGKTSLLDYIRKTNVIAGEAGGITQHIGAYNVTLDDGRHITFLDTPGHEAFTAMRARGAQVTDVAIIIIAADDDIMPQTKEAINHAMAASVPIVFAINKIDKPGANPDKIKEGLAAMNFLVEDWGGKYQSQDISAKKGTGVNELLEKVLLEAEMLDLKANPNRKGTGSIIESSLDKGRGYVATVLVSNGTLHVGDIMLAGTHYGRIKAMFNERNQRIDDVGPSQAATILGLNGAPTAGDTFHVMGSEQEAREIASKREQLQREQGLRTQKILTLDEVGRRIAMGGFKELNIIVKGDVDGSVEALSDSLIKLSAEKIAVNVLHKAVGQISESDVALAAASQAVIIGFQVRPSAAARKQAEQQGVDIRIYSIIYDAIEDVKAAMEGMLAPEVKEEVTATLEVRQVYHISKVGTVAGAFVSDGTVSRTDKARVVRDGIVVHTGHINDLKRFKDDVKEVNTNFECGISLVNYNDFKEGDIIETFKEIEVKAKL